VADQIPIPPKGQSAVEIQVQPAPHGITVTIELRSLTLVAKMKADPKLAMLFAWRALAGELHQRGVDVRAALRQIPRALTREDLSDG